MGLRFSRFGKSIANHFTKNKKRLAMIANLLLQFIEKSYLFLVASDFAIVEFVDQNQQAFHLSVQFAFV